MNKYSEKQFRQIAEKAFNKVFAGPDAYDQPFQPEISHRLFLFPYRWYLAQPWLEPIIKSMEILGENGFYVSALSRPREDVAGLSYHWYVPLSELESYGPVVYSQENAIYSINGTWGIICSDEDHAILGGPEFLVETVQNSVPDMEDRIRIFLDMWQHYHQTNGVNIEWMRPMFTHIYGIETAERILSEL